MTLLTLHARQRYRDIQQYSTEVSSFKMYFLEKKVKQALARNITTEESKLTWNSRRSLPLEKTLGKFERNKVAYAFLIFRNVRRLTQPLALCGREKDVSRMVRREFISFFMSRARIYRAPCACYVISIWFLPRYNFSQLRLVQTECLTKSMSSSPRLALSAW